MKPTDKKKHNEPFDPRNTPQPPQAKHPDPRKEKDSSPGKNTTSENKPSVDSGKRLGDETEITDETTI
jgi:hypothetical protein